MGQLLSVEHPLLNEVSFPCRSIPPDRLKLITDILESDIIIRCGQKFPQQQQQPPIMSVNVVNMFRSIHDIKATDMGADSVRFKAEVNFDGREVARMHVNKLNLEKVLQVCKEYDVYR